MNRERYEALRRLTPVDAIRAFLSGDFGIGDESAIIEPIQRDPRVNLSEEEILDTLSDAWDEQVDAETCLARLMAFS